MIRNDVMRWLCSLCVLVCASACSSVAHRSTVGDESLRGVGGDALVLGGVLRDEHGFAFSGVRPGNGEEVLEKIGNDWRCVEVSPVSVEQRPYYVRCEPRASRDVDAMWLSFSGKRLAALSVSVAPGRQVISVACDSFFRWQEELERKFGRADRKVKVGDICEGDVGEVAAYAQVCSCWDATGSRLVLRLVRSTDFVGRAALGLSLEAAESSGSCCRELR